MKERAAAWWAPEEAWRMAVLVGLAEAALEKEWEMQQQQQEEEEEEALFEFEFEWEEVWSVVVVMDWRGKGRC